MASVQSSQDMTGPGQLPNGITKEQVQRVYAVCDYHVHFMFISHCLSLLDLHGKLTPF